MIDSYILVCCSIFHIDPPSDKHIQRLSVPDIGSLSGVVFVLGNESTPQHLAHRPWHTLSSLHENEGKCITWKGKTSRILPAQRNLKHKKITIVMKSLVEI